MYSLYNGVSPTELEPSEFSIGQNYPNPFKKKTVIKYCVAYKTRVQIVVYNSEGKLIEKLVDEEKKPGTYEVEFNSLTDHSGKSKNLLDGYYFYQMIAGDYSSEKKWLGINNSLRSNKMKTFLQTLLFFLLTTQICFGQWTQVGLNDKSIKDIAVQNQNIFAITSDSGKMFRSINNGGNWTMIIDSCARDVEISLTGKVFVVIDSSLTFWNPTSLLSSMDNGVTWSQVNILEQIQDSIIIYAEYGVYNRITISPTGNVLCNIHLIVPRDLDCDWIAQSNDDGITWSTPGMGVVGGRLFDFKDQFWITIGHFSQRYGGDLNGEYIHLSIDNGNTWNYLGQSQGSYGKMPHANVIGLFSNDNIITGGLGYDSTGFPTIPVIMMSTDMCSTWTKVSSLKSQVGLSVSAGSTEGMLVGTDSLGVFLFSDEGDSLGSRNEGLTNLNIKTLTLDNNGYVYAGTENGVWRRPLSEITSVEEQEIDEIPTEFLLSQNYPNPFNSSSILRYAIPQSSNIVIKVFDILGNEIEKLVNEEKPVGTYEITWNAANLPSGVYFYQLKAGEYTAVKKMLLIK